MRLFIDTNVLFDILGQRPPFCRDARRLIFMQAFGDAELWAAPQSYLDIFYVLRKSTSCDDLQKRLALSLQRINLCTTGHEDIQKAASMAWNDLEDATIAVCCAKTGADYLITRDADGFGQSSVPAITPAEFFDMLERKYGVTYAIEGF
jgi:predicted nucleic acid-binding protein